MSSIILGPCIDALHYTHNGGPIFKASPLDSYPTSSFLPMGWLIGLINNRVRVFFFWVNTEMVNVICNIEGERYRNK
jgi:hypothetical protein